MAHYTEGSDTHTHTQLMYPILLEIISISLKFEHVFVLLFQSFDM